MLLQALRSDSDKNFPYVITDDEEWLHSSQESPKIFAHGRDNVISRM
jgi:hypothetical protein